jgi:hypothetical protein
MLSRREAIGLLGAGVGGGLAATLRRILVDNSRRFLAFVPKGA